MGIVYPRSGRHATGGSPSDTCCWDDAPLRRVTGARRARDRVGGMAFVALGELVSGRLRLRPRELALRLTLDAAPLLLIGLVPLLWLAKRARGEHALLAQPRSQLLPVGAPARAVQHAVAPEARAWGCDGGASAAAAMLSPAWYSDVSGTRADAPLRSSVVGAAAGEVLLLEPGRAPPSYVLIVSLTMYALTTILINSFNSCIMSSPTRSARFAGSRSSHCSRSRSSPTT